ncbi:MAG: M23 family metallopeptidase [Bacilli bacterium]
MNENNKNSDLLQNDAVQDLGATAVTAASGGTIPKPISKMIVKKVTNDPKIKEALDRVSMNNMMNSRMNNRKATNNSNQSSSINNNDSEESSSEDDNANNQENGIFDGINKKNQKKILIFMLPILGWALLFLIILVIISALIAPIVSTFEYLKSPIEAFNSVFKDKNKKKEMEYYKKVDSVKNHWANKGVNINTDLITATLFNQINFGSFLEEENTSDDLLATDQSVNNDIYNTAKKKVDLLAKFQIITTQYYWQGCSNNPREIKLENSNDPREIAKNDGILDAYMISEHNYQKIQVWTNFTTVEDNDGKNVKRCINPYSNKQIGASNIDGNDDLSSNSILVDKTVYRVDDKFEGVYYWNLVDEGFLEAYYTKYFTNIKTDDIEKRKINLIGDIYSVVKEFRSSKDNPEYGNENSFAYNNYLNMDGSNNVTFYSNGCNLLVGSDNFTAPTKSRNITSTCGVRDLHGNGNKSGHYAVDIAGSLDSDIYSMGNGKIIGMGLGSNTGGFNASFANMFNIVTIKYDPIEINGKSYIFTSQYLHLAYNSARINPRTQVKFKVGDDIKKGEAVAGMGSTGYSSGVHLHFAIYDQNGFTYDGKSLLK